MEDIEHRQGIGRARQIIGQPRAVSQMVGAVQMPIQRSVLTTAGKAVIERYRVIKMDTATAAREPRLALNRICRK